jgi:hypothetical protein
MQDATTVLSIIRNRGERGSPLTRLYRQLYNPQLYFQAYARLYSNDGAMTPDTTGETVDGMSREKINTMIDLIRHERWRWTPVKRIYIPKRNGKLRPLGLPSWSSKVMRSAWYVNCSTPILSRALASILTGFAQDAGATRH